MSPLFILGSALIALFAIWALWAMWWFMGRPLVAVMIAGALLGLGRALFRHSL